jgi:hypothetical protein
MSISGGKRLRRTEKKASWLQSDTASGDFIDFVSHHNFYKLSVL